MPHSVFCRGGNYSDFQLNVEETVDIILAYSDFNINLSLSFMQPHIRRNICFAGTKGFVECNMESCFLDVKYHHKKGENISIVDSQYSMNEVFYEQANFFFNKFQLSHVESELDAAYATLAIVEACKESILTSQEIKL